MDEKTQLHERIILQVITLAVIANGLVIILSTLLNQLHPRNGHLLNDLVVTLPLISGITLVYLGTLLHRRKQAAWAIVVPLYAFILGGNITQLSNNGWLHSPEHLLRNIALPLAVVTSLVAFRRFFYVKSAIQNFSFSFRIIVAMFLLIAVYGTLGYSLLDERDFHQDISAVTAFQHTMDQFDFTTSSQLTPHTRRATIFVDSLNILSAVAVGYVVISLFQPIRAKLSSQSGNRARAEELIKGHSDDSEDFFKLWPSDKAYFFNQTRTAGLSYRIQNGIALVVGDPFGKKSDFPTLIDAFSDFCRPNDWSPTYVHIEESNTHLYDRKGFQVQKIGEEAVVDVETYMETTIRSKYFRQIKNRFEKQGYTTEICRPPHSEAIQSRIKEISDQWLLIPGRQERGFMMGYHTAAYMERCNLILARDEQGEIQAFLNQIPAYQTHEANFDLLRHSKEALGNVNDYLLIGFIGEAQKMGYQQVNLGLCPWSGLDTETDDKNLVGTAMRLLYTKGNRLYSSAGLRRFKAKYEPVWRNRYVAYKGGVRGFSRSAYALNKALNRTK